MPYASIGKRFVALFIDGLIIGVAAGILSWVLPAFLESLAGLLLGIGYETWMLTNRNGQTIGKQVMNLRVVTEDGGAVTQNVALTRACMRIVSGMALFIGYLWAFFDDRRQTWHDKVAKTLVVDA